MFKDESYESGIPGGTEARFVLDLKKPPWNLNGNIFEWISHDSEFDVRRNDARLDAATSSMEASSMLSFDRSHVVATANLVEELPGYLHVLFTNKDIVTSCSL
jgi:hypothetical protein